MYSSLKEITSPKIIENIKKNVQQLPVPPYAYLNAQNVENLKNEPYTICIHGMGQKCYLYMITYNGNHCSILYDCKQERMYLCSMMFQENIYDGTIFEGEIVTNEKNKLLFLVEDLYQYKGKKVDLLEFKVRKEIMAVCIREDYIEDTSHSFYLSLKHYFSKEYIYDLRHKYIPSLSYSCSGLYFKKNSNQNEIKNYIYLFPESKKAILNASSTEINAVSEGENTLPPKKIIRVKKKSPEVPKETIEKKEEFVPPSIPKKNDTFISFMIKNTTIPEIYELYLMKGNEKEKISYASVPNIETSTFLKTLFRENHEKEIYVQCEFHDTFKKWVPLQKSDEIDNVDTLHWFQSIYSANHISANK
jgi:hypothetical protein